MVNKIAFLFLTIDNTRFPEIWEYYFKGNEDKINIYVHPKNKELVTDSFLKDNIIDDIKETSWSQVTDALLTLLITALKNKDNKYFLTVTDSCLPIKSFDIFYNFLFNNDIKKSYIKLFSDKNKEETIKYFFDKKNYNKYFSKNYNFVKHESWFCLSRHHLKKLLSNKDIYKFKKLHVSNELFLSPIFPSNNIINYEITFIDWSNAKIADKITKKIEILWKEYDETHNKKILKKIKKLKLLRMDYGKHPKIFNKINSSLIRKMKKSKSFFWRKFDKDSNIIKYYKKLI